MKRIICYFVCLLNITLVAAQTKTEADSAYAQEDYSKAITIYEKLLEEGKNATLYYNLGNSYYRDNRIGKAILNYERALELEPGDSHIRFNLDMARSKTIDKIPPSSEMFFITWTRSLKNQLSADRWALMANITFIMMLLAIALYVFGRQLILKQIAFFLALLLLVTTLSNHLFGYSQRTALQKRNNAVVMEEEVKVRSTPNDSGTELFELHEGTKVKITDNNMREWKEIRLTNGKVGWLPTSAIEVI